MDTLPVPTDNN